MEADVPIGPSPLRSSSGRGDFPPKSEADLFLGLEYDEEHRPDADQQEAAKGGNACGAKDRLHRRQIGKGELRSGHGD